MHVQANPVSKYRGLNVKLHKHVLINNNIWIYFSSKHTPLSIIHYGNVATKIGFKLLSVD